MGPGRPAPTVHFDRPATISATYLLTEMQKRVDTGLSLVVRDEISQTWEVVTGTVHLTQQVVSAQTNHLSLYGLTGPDDDLLSPSLDAFEVGLFRGGSLYNTDLRLPDGAGGLTPILPH